MSAEPPSETIDRLVSEFLDALPQEYRQVVYLSAIPNAINPELLQKLTANTLLDTEFLERLRDYYLLDKGVGDWYSYSPDVHKTLRAFWRQPAHQLEYKAANQIVIVYFEQLAARTSRPGNYIYEQEVLYHRLLEDERSGLDYLAALFEDACDQRQIGAAQNFCLTLNRTLPQLSSLAAQYALYYERRIDFLLNHRANLENQLNTLIHETPDPLLKAQSGLLLGQVLLGRYEWKRSRDVLKASLDELERLKAWRFAARAMLALGDIYVDLVENSGGVQFGRSTDRSRFSQILTNVLFLPFLLLSWLRRNIWFLPGWFYFGGNYQEWILNYLLQMAGRWYGQARRTAQKANDDLSLENALLGEANVAVQQGRAAKARRKYAKLAALPAIRESTYRLAQIHTGQGLIALLSNQSVTADRELQTALNIYRAFADEANAGRVAEALGQNCLQQNDSEAAAQAFLLAFHFYAESREIVSQTRVSWELELLVEKRQVGPETDRKIQDALPLLQEKQFVARYPTDLLRRFRNLATRIVLPISYFLGLFFSLLAFVALLLVGNIELDAKTGHLSAADFLSLVFIGILPIAMNFWIVELVYAAVGQVWVLLAGHQSLNKFGEQPDRIFLGPESIAVDSPGLGEPIRIGWDEVREIVSADYRLWQRSIYLYSRLGIVASGKSIIVDGITSGYRQICKEVFQRKGDLLHKPGADTAILTHPTTYAALVVAFLHALDLVLTGKVVMTLENLDTHQTAVLHLPPLLAVFSLNILIILPPLLLWRINLHRRRFSKRLCKRQRKLLNIISFGVTILLTIVAILWLSITPFLTLPDIGDSQDTVPLQQAIPLADTMQSLVYEGHALMPVWRGSLQSALPTYPNQASLFLKNI